MEIVMKKIGALIVLVVIVAAGVVFIPRITHNCDDCGRFFIGSGYEPNVVEGLLADEEQTICKGCAEEQHALAILMGKSVNDFKKDLFE